MAQSRKLISLNSVFFDMSIAKICSTNIYAGENSYPEGSSPSYKYTTSHKLQIILIWNKGVQNDLNRKHFCLFTQHCFKNGIVYRNVTCGDFFSSFFQFHEKRLSQSLPSSAWMVLLEYTMLLTKYSVDLLH